MVTFIIKLKSRAMKKILFTAITLFSYGAALIAQPTLTSTNFTPVVGDNQFYYVADSNSVIDNTVGANVIFNYSGLQTYGITQTQSYVNPATTTYTGDFPAATYADSTSSFPINKNYTQAIATDSLMNIGFVANNTAQGTVVVKYSTNAEKIMQFPFNFNNFFIDDYSGVFTLTVASIPINTNGNGQATVNADAWGTLQLPMGVTIDSVLRVKTIEYLVTDTVKPGAPFPNILPITVNASYVNYYKPSISKFPLLSFITGSSVQGGSILDSTQQVITQYPMPTVGIDELNANSINLSLYPNPTKNNYSTLSFNLENNTEAAINVLNSLGQNVQPVYSGNLPQGKNEIIVKTANLSRGLYFVSIKLGNKITTQKLLIE
jgi:hypothetical protein